MFLVMWLLLPGLGFVSLGPCFENGGRPIGDTSGIVLKCDDDDGTYKLRQFNRTERWCVFPNNGSEISGSRVTRPDNVNCNKFGMVYRLEYHYALYMYSDVVQHPVD